ncbi:uncharacterized protein LTR77_007811 [Saxophila tyrrhenica]|uniref:DRBM domain-containing protein n=1 Tax=Saxophila tyrrhenica TaxID=1690608 RepID=A0AAV9P334_9PEZI|nr:hypothetical protein LTR77_007811 [Saxophila tyrrhenica]
MSGKSTPSATATSDRGSGPYQDQLVSKPMYPHLQTDYQLMRNADLCQQHNVRLPDYQIVSDKRGGRTAWSCKVFVCGLQVDARFWYDGERANQSREDASEEALVRLGAISRSGVSPSQALQAAQQAGQSGNQQQQRSYAPTRGR